MSRRPCYRTQDHPAHLWLQNRQRMECPGVGGDTGIVLVDTNDETLVERLARMRFEDWYGSQFGDAPHENARIPHGFTAEARWYLAALREAT